LALLLSFVEIITAEIEKFPILGGRLGVVIASTRLIRGGNEA
jgi:hypothetical protein